MPGDRATGCFKIKASDSLATYAAIQNNVLIDLLTEFN